MFEDEETPDWLVALMAHTDERQKLLRPWLDLLERMSFDQSIDVHRAKVRAFHFFSDLDYALEGFGVRLRMDGPFYRKQRFKRQRKQRFKRPAYSWAHLPLSAYLHQGANHANVLVSIDHERVVELAEEYLTMPWLRHPRIDWLFLDVLTFFSAKDHVHSLRNGLAHQAGWSQKKINNEIYARSLPELKWMATKGKVRAMSLFWGIGLVMPTAILMSSESRGFFGTMLTIGSVVLLGLFLLALALLLFGWLMRAMKGPGPGRDRPSDVANRLEAQAAQAVELYDILDSTAVPLKLFMQKLGAMVARSPKFAPPVLHAILDRAIEKDGSVLVVTPH